MNAQHKRAKTKKKSIPALKLLFVAVISFMIIKGVMYQPDITKNKAEIERLQSQLDYEQARQEEVDALKEKVNTDEYIEKVAREKLGLVKENEKIFIDAVGHND